MNLLWLLTLYTSVFGPVDFMISTYALFSKQKCSKVKIPYIAKKFLIFGSNFTSTKILLNNNVSKFAQVFCYSHTFAMS